MWGSQEARQARVREVLAGHSLPHRADETSSPLAVSAYPPVPTRLTPTATGGLEMDSR